MNQLGNGVHLTGLARLGWTSASQLLPVVTRVESCFFREVTQRVQPPAPLLAVPLGSQGQQSERQLPARLLHLLVLLGAVALPTSALCEAPQEKPSSLLALAKAKLQSVWTDIDQDLHRSEAELPFLPAQARVEAPQIRWHGDKVCVNFALRPGANLTDVILSLVTSLGSQQQPGSQAVTSNQLQAEAVRSGAAQLLQFGPVGGDAAGLVAQLWMPAARDRQPEVEFQKRGPLTDSDVSAIAAVLRSANTLIKERSGPGWATREWSWSSSDSVNGSGGGSVGPPGAGGFGGPLGDLGSQLDAIMQLMWGADEVFRGMRGWADQGDEPDEQQWQGHPGEHRGPHSLPAPCPTPWPHQQRRLLPPDGSSERGPALPQAGYAYGSAAADQAVQKLQSLGAKVYPPEAKDVMDWGVLAGYEEQKARIEDTMLLALKHPEVFDEVARGTRRHYASNCPRAVLFEGPPGCGKTTSARVIASQASVPLVYVPLEALASKWYGESEKLLSQVFEAASALQGAIVFLDELDALATTRSSEMHEATRRLLGVLLRQLDGFQTGEGGKTVVLGATNRKQDLDPALLSRFDASITFQLPSCECRKQIIAQYAQHLKEADVAALAEATDGMSGRDLRDVCEQAERRWAALIVRKQAKRGSFPPAAEYQQAARQRVQDKTLPKSSFPRFF